VNNSESLQSYVYLLPRPPCQWPKRATAV